MIIVSKSGRFVDYFKALNPAAECHVIVSWLLALYCVLRRFGGTFYFHLQGDLIGFR